MLSIIHVDRIQDCLRSVAQVVNSQQRREVDFPRLVLEWLATAESVLNDARQPSLAQVAGLRSALLTALHGPRRVNGQSRRALLEAAASEALRKGQEVLAATIESRTAQIGEAELMVSRVLAVAEVKGLLGAVPEELDHPAKLRFLIEAFKQDADTAGATVHFIGILGPVDATVVLDRALGPRLVS